MAEIERLGILSEIQRAYIEGPLIRHAELAGHRLESTEINLALMEDDQIVGGLTARAHWGWIRVEAVGVPRRMRGQRLGLRLMEELESIGRSEGYTGIRLDTVTFQAPKFYEKMGYIEFGRIEDHPPGETCIFFYKRLDGGQGAD